MQNFFQNRTNSTANQNGKTSVPDSNDQKQITESENSNGLNDLLDINWNDFEEEYKQVKNEISPSEDIRNMKINSIVPHYKALFGDRDQKWQNNLNTEFAGNLNNINVNLNQNKEPERNLGFIKMNEEQMLKANKLEVGGYNVYFPFEPYDIQKNFITKLIEA